MSIRFSYYHELNETTTDGGVIDTTGNAAANINLWVNGVDRTENLQPDATGWAVETGMAKIGGRGSDPNAPQTHSGAQDEMAIWLNRVLTADDVTLLWQAAQGNLTSVPPPVLHSIDRVPNGASATLTFASQPARTYAVDYSTSLAAESWTTRTATVASQGLQTAYTDTQHAGLSHAYYRVRDVTP